MSNDVPMPHNDWKFDKGVSDKFDAHIRQSVPMYEIFHKLIADISEFYIQDKSSVYDIGMSTGYALKLLYEKVSGTSKAVSFFGVDNSEPMCDIARRNCPFATIDTNDFLSDTYSMSNASYCAAVLTLQFVPFHRHLDFCKKVCNGLNKGGAFVLVEKVVCTDPRIDEMALELYHDFKLNQGISKEDIFDKTRSIRGVMRPYTANENLDVLKGAGFSNVDVFFRYLNFCGFIAVK